MIEIPMTPEQFAARRQQAAQQGIELTGDAGTLTRSGVTARYAYAAGVLTVEILEKPFFISTQYCEDQLRKFLDA